MPAKACNTMLHKNLQFLTGVMDNTGWHVWWPQNDKGCLHVHYHELFFSFLLQQVIRNCILKQKLKETAAVQLPKQKAKTALSQLNLVAGLDEISHQLQQPNDVREWKNKQRFFQLTVSTFTHPEVRGHPMSPAMSPFDRAHATSVWL